MEERASRLLRSRHQMTRIRVVYDNGDDMFRLASGRELLLDRWGRPLERGET